MYYAASLFSTQPSSVAGLCPERTRDCPWSINRCFGRWNLPDCLCFGSSNSPFPGCSSGDAEIKLPHRYPHELSGPKGHDVAPFATNTGSPVVHGRILWTHVFRFELATIVSTGRRTSMLCSPWNSHWGDRFGRDASLLSLHYSLKRIRTRFWMGHVCGLLSTPP